MSNEKKKIQRNMINNTTHKSGYSVDTTMRNKEERREREYQ